MHGHGKNAKGYRDVWVEHEAMTQGENRFERGQNFFKEARKRTGELKCTFGWHIQVVPGAAHQNSDMPGPAAAVLLGG
jgi:hypothetical protein